MIGSDWGPAWLWIAWPLFVIALPVGFIVISWIVER
jgi:hypothetical protein